MRILYLKTDCCADGSAQFVDINRYEVVDAASFDNALRHLTTSCFDAVLIDDGGDPDTVQFIIDARVVRPDVPIFVTSAWGADLVAALSSIEAATELASAS